MTHTGGLDTNIIAPKVLIIPNETPASTQANAGSGAIVISGAELFYSVGNTWKKITAT